jgi:hypothetical protein
VKRDKKFNSNKCSASKKSSGIKKPSISSKTSGSDTVDELKKISFEVFIILGVITIFIYIYKKYNPDTFIGLDERLLIATLLFGSLGIIIHLTNVKHK